mmetsp:Transcript_2921/g.9119  ORF Transcript_2921/g.9119 Transcript_2921/m.9119 type:complete len:227 (+) Transcript_2921:1340-2020(+)
MPPWGAIRQIIDAMHPRLYLLIDKVIHNLLRSQRVGTHVTPCHDRGHAPPTARPRLHNAGVAAHLLPGKRVLVLGQVSLRTCHDRPQDALDQRLCRRLLGTATRARGGPPRRRRPSSQPHVGPLPADSLHGSEEAPRREAQAQARERPPRSVGRLRGCSGRERPGGDRRRELDSGQQGVDGLAALQTPLHPHEARHDASEEVQGVHLRDAQAVAIRQLKGSGERLS